MKWVLLAVILAGSDRPAAIAHDFETRETCERAASLVREKLRYSNGAWAEPKVICVQK